ncbi:MAG: hypothetical protein WC632_01040 [Candidatus Margulisiibacteriota bacterium]
MIDRLTGSTGPGVHKCGVVWQASDLGLAAKLNSGARIVALRLTGRLRSVRDKLEFAVPTLFNTHGFAAGLGLNELKVQEKIVAEISQVTGLNVCLLDLSEGREVLEAPRLARFRQALKRNNISSFATQVSSNPDLGCRLHGNILANGVAGGITYFKGNTPTNVSSAEFGLLLVVRDK